jgi:hypothetical protein
LPTLIRHDCPHLQRCRKEELATFVHTVEASPRERMMELIFKRHRVAATKVMLGAADLGSRPFTISSLAAFTDANIAALRPPTCHDRYVSCPLPASS